MVDKIQINIDGRELVCHRGQTILEVARENGIEIPTLCFDERTEIYGSCGICVVEVEGNPKLLKSCATEVAPGMVVNTRSKRVIESRKTNLELLLSNHRGDCRPPCAKACPAQTDCQGYVGLIAEGRFREAFDLIKENIPLPGSIGRVCPHPCEKACRRGLQDEPISIVELKRVAADTVYDGHEAFLPVCEKPTGKKVAVIGGGPYGLSMAYFLARYGHSVTIYESMPYAGGMLRYGIPEYRLPKSVLQQEIDFICEMGVELVTNTRVGEDISFESLQRKYDAICLGIGAWKSTGVHCEGDDAKGIIGGIEFLGNIERNVSFFMGKRVAVIGGGNTAMDACRSAVRFGSEKVYNIYRRTKDEMPAAPDEIKEAGEEGVIFKNLRNPLKIHKNKNGEVSGMTLQVMELGEPDESGRRSPHAVEGKTEELDVDMIIMAIGQQVNPEGIDGVEFTKKDSIMYDPKTFMTKIPGVFAGGDCGNDKVSIAVEAIGDAKKGSEVVNSYLKGDIIPYEPEYNVVRDDITEETFEDRERQFRPKKLEMAPEVRRTIFLESPGYTKEQAIEDASRCLECGCKDYFECKLIKFANQYNVEPERFMGEVQDHPEENGDRFIIRDPNKCILCGLCVRVCDQVMGVGALGFVERGFDTVVLPALRKNLSEAGCISCGQCVTMCPTGALQEVQPQKKQIPQKTEKIKAVCSHCSIGCTQVIEVYNDRLVKSRPDKFGAVNRGLLCANGKFGFSSADNGEGIIKRSLIKQKDGTFEESGHHAAMMITVRNMMSIISRYSHDAMALAISGRVTNEEAFVAKSIADKFGIKVFSFSNRRNGVKEVFGVDASMNTMDELLGTEVIVVAGYYVNANPIMRVKLMQASKNGAKVIFVCAKGRVPQNIAFAHSIIEVDDSVDFFRAMAKAVIKEKDDDELEKLEGFDEFKKSVSRVKVSDEAQELANLYAGAKKAMFVYQQNIVSEECARLIAEIAAISGHIGSPRDGIVLLRPENNSQGLIYLGITDGPEVLEGVRGLIIIGEDPDPKYLKDLDFLMVCDTHMTQAARMADIVLSGPAPIHADGTFINTERRLQSTNAVAKPYGPTSNEIARSFSKRISIELPYKNLDDIQRDMKSNLAFYRSVEDGEIIGGGVLKPEKITFYKSKADKFIDQVKGTDHLRIFP